MNPELLAVRVLKSVRVDSTSLDIGGHDGGVLGVVEEAVEVDIDQVGVLGDFGSLRHGQVEWVVVLEEGHREGVGALARNHLVDLLDLGVDHDLCLGQLVLNDFVDHVGGLVHEPVEEGVLHLDGDGVKGDLGGLHEGPVHLVSGGGLNHEVNGEVAHLHVAGLERNEVEGVELGVDVHIDIHASDLNVDLVGALDLLEDL
mmetsp:Transcript_5416/g.9108  ORF Transcript_5416/g.9108 Transcript_5416/m.9108 type:complete len:201 (-) Transcript_5416:386-988(-)